MMGAVSQPTNLPPHHHCTKPSGWCLGLKRKKKTWEDEYIWGAEKGNFTLVSLHDWCPPAKPVICPWRVVAPLFLLPLPSIFGSSDRSSPPDSPRMAPICAVNRRRAASVGAGRQACAEAACRRGQDPGRREGACTTQAGRERETQRWPLRAHVSCLT